MEALNLLIVPFAVAIGFSLGIVWTQLKSKKDKRVVHGHSIRYLANRERGLSNGSRYKS